MKLKRQFIAIFACFFTDENAISYASTNAALMAAYGYCCLHFANYDVVNLASVNTT
jgi:hypothetical protein